MHFTKRIFAIVIGIFFTASAVYAQGGQQQQMATPDSVSNEELQKFANASDKLQTIQQSVQDDVKALVEEKGMEFTRFQDIMRSRQNPQVKEVETTEEEDQKVKEIQPDLQKINRQARTRLMQAIQKEGLSPFRFQQIARAVQMNPELAKRLQQVSTEEGN